MATSPHPGVPSPASPHPWQSQTHIAPLHGHTTPPGGPQPHVPPPTAKPDSPCTPAHPPHPTRGSPALCPPTHGEPGLTLHSEGQGRVGAAEGAARPALVLSLIFLRCLAELQPQRVGGLPRVVPGWGGSGGHQLPPLEQGELGRGVALDGAEEDDCGPLAALHEGLQLRVPGGVCGKGRGRRGGPWGQLSAPLAPQPPSRSEPPAAYDQRHPWGIAHPESGGGRGARGWSRGSRALPGSAPPPPPSQQV